MTRREWLQLSAASTLTGGLQFPLALAQEPAKAKSPDEMIHEYLAAEVKRLSARFMDGAKTKDEWEAKRPRLKERVPRHARPLAAAREDAAEGDRHRHARTRRRRRSRSCTSRASRGCTSPATCTGRRTPARSKKLPAILYVCGHSGRGRDGNKTAFQDHGLWFAIERLRLPRRRHAAARRDRRHPPRHVQPRTASGGTAAATRRPASSAGTASAASTTSCSRPDVDPEQDRRHRHLRRRRDDGLDRRRRRPREGRRARSAA